MYAHAYALNPDDSRNSNMAGRNLQTRLQTQIKLHILVLYFSAILF